MNDVLPPLSQLIGKTLEVALDYMAKNHASYTVFAIPVGMDPAEMLAPGADIDAAVLWFDDDMRVARIEQGGTPARE